jgi:hypothetical protein
VSNLNPSQFKVLDFNAAKQVKARTGRAAAVPVDNSHYSAALQAHDDQAIALTHPIAKKENPLVKAGKWLGLYPE